MLGKTALMVAILITVNIWHVYWEMFLPQSSIDIFVVLKPPNFHKNEKRTKREQKN